MSQFLTLLDKSVKIEKKAAKNYLKTLNKLKTEEFREVISTVALETVFHREITKALKRSADMIIEIQKQIEKGGETKEEIEYSEIEKVLKRHLRIEYDMIATYEIMSKYFPNLPSLFKRILVELKEDEIEHHRKISELIEKIKKK